MCKKNIGTNNITKDGNDPYDGKSFVLYERGSKEEDEFLEKINSKNFHESNTYAAEIAKKRNWVGLLGKWTPEQIILMDSKIEVAKGETIRKAILYFIISITVAYFFGYDACANKALGMIDKYEICRGIENDWCFKNVQALERDLKKYLTPFKNLWY